MLLRQLEEKHQRIKVTIKPRDDTCMSRNVKIIVTVLVVGVTIAAVTAFYIWNKPHRDVRDEEGLQISASAIYDSFSTNEQRANAMYLNKVITVTGKVSAVKQNQSGFPVVILQSNDGVFGVNCTLKEPANNIAAGNTVSIKGICTGYLSDVILNQGIQLK